jgi:hypothetical protein
MAERGYPMGDFAAQADLISVDHPDVVENFRIAHAIQERAAAHQASTEDLRVAMLRYRSLFEELLRPEQEASDEAGTGTAATDGTGDTVVGRLRSAHNGPDVAAPGPAGSTTAPAGERPTPAADESVEAGRGAGRSTGRLGTDPGANDDAR